jgi:RimJ/RimL family protein N-acetyltransferase
VTPDIPTIETERLLLRPIRPADLDEWTVLIWADPDVMTYHNEVDLSPRERAERIMELHALSWHDNGYGGLLIVDKKTGEMLGDCSLEDAQESGELELSYSVRRDRWGRGIATEATRALVRYGFERAGLKRIAGIVSLDNPASVEVLNHLGFVFEKEKNLYGFHTRCYGITPDRLVTPGGMSFVIRDGASHVSDRARKRTSGSQI